MPTFKDDSVLIIAPGSQTTLVQLGLPESLTPARFRYRSCLFPGEKPNEFEPNKIRKRAKTTASQSVAEAAGTTTETNGDAPKPDAEQDEYEEDPLSEESAIWPIRAGHIVNWPCFFALLSHIWTSINPSFHTPILLVAEPCWTPREHEKITQYIFEKFSVPAFLIIDSAMATMYGYGLETATVIDVGHEKADVSAIAGFIPYTTGRAVGVQDCGGEAMTQHLLSLLSGKKFTRDMCEQLKKSQICEVLPSDVELPTNAGAADTHQAQNPAAAASTGGNEPSTTATVESTRSAGENAGVEKSTGEDDEGVLDIASIVTGGKMNEFIEAKEKEKAEKVAAKKKGGDAAAAAAPKVVRLPNSKRVKNTFPYEDHKLHDVLKGLNVSGNQMAEMQAAVDGTEVKKAAEGAEANGTAGDTPSITSGPIRREIEVGIERFQAVDAALLDRISDAVYRTIMSVEDQEKRPSLWDSLVVVGNGSKIRGFKEALLARLQSKYQISPSSATIFTSELPSNMSTPMATGMNTPQPQFPVLASGGGSGVNPLLVAATTAQSGFPQSHGAATSGYAGNNPALQDFSRHHHGQTPTSIKFVKIPEYFPEWKDAGYEEAAFLGAQVAAKVLFTSSDSAVQKEKTYMTRTDYNDSGPQGIHEYSL